jgi:hypothetical protein
MSTIHDRTMPIFAQTTLQFGPIDVLGRTILYAEQLANQVGVSLELATGEEFLAVNTANRQTWRPLVSLLDHRFNCDDQTQSLYLIGRNKTGDVVAGQAIRGYDWHQSNFADFVENLPPGYRNPDTQSDPIETYRVTSLAARGTTGKVAYSGGAWYRPDYRGQGLVEWLPRLARAYARGVWDTRTTITLMEEKNVAKGVFPRNGYRYLEWSVFLENQGSGSLKAAFLWMKDNEMLEDLAQFLASLEKRNGAALIAAGGKK